MWQGVVAKSARPQNREYSNAVVAMSDYISDKSLIEIGRYRRYFTAQK